MSVIRILVREGGRQLEFAKGPRNGVVARVVGDRHWTNVKSVWIGKRPAKFLRMVADIVADDVED